MTTPASRTIPRPDAEGYPPRVDVSRRLAMFSASLPDHYETFRPKLDKPNDPTVAGKEPGTFVANERYKDAPGAVFRFGNLPAMINASVHSGEDVILTAMRAGQRPRARATRQYRGVPRHRRGARPRPQRVSRQPASLAAPAPPAHPAGCACLDRSEPI